MATKQPTLLTVAQLREALAPLDGDMAITCGALTSNALWPITGISFVRGNSFVPAKLILHTERLVTEPKNVHAERVYIKLPEFTAE